MDWATHFANWLDPRFYVLTIRAAREYAKLVYGPEQAGLRFSRELAAKNYKLITQANSERHIPKLPDPGTRDIVYGDSKGPDGSVSAAAAAEGIAVGARTFIDFLGHQARKMGGGRIRAVGRDGRVAAESERSAAVRLHEIGSVGNGKANFVLLSPCILRKVFAVRYRRDVLEEPAPVILRLREIKREAGFGIRKTTVDVAVPYGSVAPFVYVYER